MSLLQMKDLRNMQMDQTKRMLLAVALSFLLITVWQYVFPFEPTPVPPATPAKTEPAPTLAAPSEKAPAPQGTPAPGSADMDAVPVTTVRVERPNVHYALSTQGAGFTQAQLQGAKTREAQDLSIADGFKKLAGKKIPEPKQVDLGVPADKLPLLFSVSVNGSSPIASNAKYVLENSPVSSELTFTTRNQNLELLKRVSFASDGFDFNYALELKNTGTGPFQGEVILHSTLGIDPQHEQAPSMLAGLGNQARATCFVDEKLRHIVPKTGEIVKEEYAGAISFFGLDQSYFLAALFPLDKALTGKCLLNATSTSRQADVVFPITLAAGETLKLPFGGYIGPKDADVLTSVAGLNGQVVLQKTPQANVYRPQLEKAIDFGIFEIICRLLLSIMKVFFRLTGNWGVAIILLTVLVKVALLPLTHKQMVSAEQMKGLQPKVEALKKKFANDRERQNMEMMKLYQEAGVNPLGGCLPILFQMPVWIALFQTLRTSYELYREPFFGSLYTDLTAKDPTYFLPLALGVTMIVTQKLQPQMMDATQAKIMTWFMPIMFTALMLQYPAGLTLYIFTNNILSIVQQFGLRKYLEKKGIAQPQAKDAKKLVKGKA